MKQIFLMTLVGIFAASCTTTPKKITVEYPETYKGSVSDDYFGTKVADPYRWLEDDNSEETKAWVTAQNEVTNAYLDQIPARNAIRERLEEVWNYPKVSAPFEKAGMYFEYRNDGLQNQDVLYIKTSAEDKGEVLLDPNTLSEDGTVALSSIAVSKDGKYLAYSISRGGSDWVEIFVRDIQTKQDISDHIMWAKFTGMTWHGDGFYYTRYPAPKDGDALKGENTNSMVYFHKAGTEQSEDKLIYKDDTNPEWGFGVSLSDDKEVMVLHITESTSGNAVSYKKANAKKWNKLVTAFDKDFTFIDVVNGKMVFYTNHNAPNYRLIAIDPSKPEESNWVELLAERKSVMVDVSVVGDKFFVEYLEDVKSAVYAHATDGKLLYKVDLPIIGTVSGFGAHNAAKVFYYTMTSFTTPGTIYKYDVEKNESLELRKSAIDFDASGYETKQVFYTSKDGTKVPMFITHKKGLKLDGSNPTLLYAYGGFNISLTPSFSVTRLIWLENDGIIAIPNLRGGGEYGEKWHKAGTLMQKQNVFDDFIAAAEYLIDEKYTSSPKLTIEGGSNGGLLIGAVVNQRPELYAAAHAAVGVMDMLRYQEFTIGRYWATDYGTSADSKEMFEYLYNYSPVHTVKNNVDYPAVLVTTADHDDRVVPAHSFKYAAALQEATTGDNAKLIRIEVNAGHGAGKPTSMIMDYYADVWAFAFYNMNAPLKYE